MHAQRDVKTSRYLTTKRIVLFFVALDSKIKIINMKAILKLSVQGYLLLYLAVRNVVVVTAWNLNSYQSGRRNTFITRLAEASSTSLRIQGSKHGENACFLPLKQFEQDTYAPRIVQIAGSYPGITREEFFSVQSEPAPPMGQWTYDFSDPDGSQLGTVAIEGSAVVSNCIDPVVIIAEHPSLGVQLPEAIGEAVDLVVLVDRSKNRYGDRKFLVLGFPNNDELFISAYNEKSELPNDCEILGQVEIVQIPWLPSMAPTKTGFLESDEYY